jgi:hypothetical protein
MASNRTASGSPTAAARKSSGGGKGMKPGSFPVEDKGMADSAINLRGHAPSPDAVLDKVSRYASKTGDEGLKNRVAAARKKDRS